MKLSILSVPIPIFCFALIFKSNDNIVFGTYLDDARGFMVDFGSAMNVGVDSIDRIKHLGARTFAFSKSAGPVAALFAGSAHSALQLDNDAVQAIKFMHRSIKDEFAALDRQLQDRANIQEYNDLLAEYREKVELPLEHITLQLRWSTDPEMWSDYENPPSAQTRSIFANQCLGQESPIRLIMVFNELYNRNCPVYTTSKIYMQALDLFAEIEAHEHFPAELTGIQHDFPKWKKIQALILSNITNVPYQIAYRELKRLRQEIIGSPEKEGLLNTLPPNGTFDATHVFKGLHSTIAGYHPLGSRCILNSATSLFDYQRKPLFDIVDMLGIAIGKLELLGILCANISTGGNQKLMTAYEDEMETKITAIVDKITRWIPKKLSEYWPLPIVSHAKKNVLDFIKNGQDVTDGYAYAPIAREIKYGTSSRGTAGYSYQVLVLPAWDSQKYFFAKCNVVQSCQIIKNFKKMHIIITRYAHEEALGRASVAWDWFNTTAAPNITQFLSDHYKSDHLGGMMARMNTLLNDSLYNGEYYRNHFLSHNSKFFGMSCKILYGLAGDEILPAIYAYNSASYYRNPLFYNAQRFIFFALI